MAKPSQGRFDGLYGMRKFTAQELFTWADQYESRIPANFDDPKWLQRRADRIRRLAIAKEQSLELKLREARRRTRGRRPWLDAVILFNATDDQDD